MPVPIRLIAIDLDGTLLNRRGQVPGHVARVVGAARDRGVQVVLATARPPRSARPFHEGMGLATPGITYHGALVYDYAAERAIRHRPLEAALAAAAVREARAACPEIDVNLERLDRWYTDRIDPRWPTAVSRVFEPDAVGPLDRFFDAPVTKLLFLADPPDIERVGARLMRKFPGRITFAVSDRHMLQVVHPGVDKGRALAWLAGREGIGREAVMAIGDAPNDLGMLRWAGCGVAVANAWPAVRRAADHRVASHEAAGVAEAILRYAGGGGGGAGSGA